MALPGVTKKKFKKYFYDKKIFKLIKDINFCYIQQLIHEIKKS